VSLAHQTALVTGTDSNGIGRATAIALAHAGADVACHWYRDRAAVDALVQEIATLGRRAVAIEGDFRVAGVARRMVHEATEKLGAPGLLVCNAGMILRQTFLDIRDEEWDAIHAVDLKAVFQASQEAARAMIARGEGGRIVLISSVNQAHANPNIAHYCAAKGGVMMLGRAMALELAPHRITVNMVAPGTIETDLNRHMLADAAFRAAKLQPVPLARAGTPEDVAGAVVFLCSESAGYMTGSTLTIDGGLTIS
jgi:NAD(P)-dependent dehydrogenase (short-subunit alcohol dehydrogenase family)